MDPIKPKIKVTHASHKSLTFYFLGNECNAEDDPTYNKTIDHTAFYSIIVSSWPRHAVKYYLIKEWQRGHELFSETSFLTKDELFELLGPQFEAVFYKWYTKPWLPQEQEYASEFAKEYDSTI